MSYSQALEEQLKLYREEREMTASQHQSSSQKKLSGSLAAMLEGAESFYWAPPICDLIARSHDPVLDGTIFREELLPVRNGFWWFAAPLGLPRWDGDDTDMRALVWKTQPKGVTVASYHYFWGNYTHDDGRRAMASMGEWDWEFGQPISEVYAHAIAEYGIPVDDWWISAARAFVAGLLFIDQKILIGSRQQVERQTRKRLEREGFTHEPLVRVVELRRKQIRSEHHGDSEPGEWSHQWIVSGHWRQQWYPSLNANQPRWIMPYVKGPEDKPLKPPRAKVFAVVR